MKPGSKNSYSSLSDLEIGGKKYKYYSIKAAEKNGLYGVSKLPKSLKVLLENLLRYARRRSHGLVLPSRVP